MARKRRLSKKEEAQVLPIIKEFNKLSSSFLKLLGQKVDQKERQVAKIAVMVRGVSKPIGNESSTINIKTVDINKTIIKKQGGFSFNKKMDWEDDLRKKRRGLIL